MQVEIASAALSLRNAVRATNEELRAIRGAIPRTGFPHQALVEALPPDGAIAGFLDSYLADVTSVHTSYTLDALRKLLRYLRGLHLTTQRIRSAVEWSSEFSAIDWWIGRRAKELGMPEKIVLVAPGPLDNFRIEKTSEFREHIVGILSDETLAGMSTDVIDPLKQSVDRLEHFHLLTVPTPEGISPAWRPVVLGHEIAHLRFTTDWARQWMMGLDLEAPGELVQETSERLKAKEALPIWLRRLINWVTEVACDSVATFYYGPEAVQALQAHYAGVGYPFASDTHPRHEIRHAIQLANDEGSLEEFRGYMHGDDYQRARAPLIEYALPLREEVHSTLSADVPLDNDVTERTLESTKVALEGGALPSSHEWPSSGLADVTASIEIGLVRGYWQRRIELLGTAPEAEAIAVESPPVAAADEPEAVDPDDAVEGDSADTDEAIIDFRQNALVSQALDALEFAARFDENVAKADTNRLPERPTPNVLWLSPKGVMIDPEDEYGPASHDLRLGRHFIVFQRNAVSHLESIGSVQSRPAPVQRSVEVGWGDEFILHPSELVLAVTFEEVRTSLDCVAQVLSRSSLGRLGLLSATAIHIQPGFVGTLTLELVNLASVPLRLTPGQRIAQIVPIPSQARQEGYSGSYQDQRGKPQFSAATKDWDAEVLRAMKPNKPERTDSAVV